MAVPFQKLDYVVDRRGFISMVIFNTHPPEHVFVSPKYFPARGGTWEHHASGRRYNRFEYYWNIKQAEDGRGGNRVYEVDKNPLHQYDTSVAASFQEHLVHDPCHGVPMYALPVVDVMTRHDARAAYAAMVARRPASVQRFGHVLDLVASTFPVEQVGLTGSFLYGLHQDFSDVNLVLYDEGPVRRFHQFLVDNDGLVPRQDLDLLVPGRDMPSFTWHDHARFEASSPVDPPAGDAYARRALVVERRFIGSIHDPVDYQARAGFWLANTVDAHPHGTFTKRATGIALVSCRVRNWAAGMPSGRFNIDRVHVLGTQALQDGVEMPATIPVSTLQVIGEFNRMFIVNEDILAFGLIQETHVVGKDTPEMELLVGGREVGGWVLPVALNT